MGKKPDKDTRFSKFGTVSFTQTTAVNDFIDHLEENKVMGTRCQACDLDFFPPRRDCCSCQSSDLEWFEVAGNGKLVTYSQLKFGPIGFEDDLPYAIALLDYGSYKVFGRIADGIPMEDVKIGMPMKTVVNTLSNGQLNYVFQKA